MSPPDEIHPSIGVEGMLRLSDCFAPEPKKVRRMLLALRRHHRWSQRFAAAVFGVPITTMTKWESGKRNPSGAAAKFIFLLHALLVEKTTVKNCWDLAHWGKFPCRGDLVAAIVLGGTYSVPEETIREWAGPGEGKDPGSV